MSNTTNFDIPSSLFTISEYAIGYALEALQSADPLVPFVISWRGDDTTIERYMQSAYDDSIELAMRNVSACDESVSAYAVVWCGYIEDGGRKKDAVIIEAGDRFSDDAIHLARPYTQTRDGIELQGDITALGRSPNLLDSKINAFNMDKHLIKPAYVSTEGFKMDVLSHSYAKMPAAIICLAANLCEGDTTDRIAVGIRKLQALESQDLPPLSRRVFSLVFTTVAEQGDLLNVLGTDDLADMIKLILDGAQQLNQSIQDRLVSKEHVNAYYSHLHELMNAVLTDNGKLKTATGSEQLTKLLGAAIAA